MMQTAQTRSPAPLLSALASRPYTLLGLIFLTVLVVPFLRREQDWVTVFLPAAQRLASGADIYGAGFVYPPINAWLPLPFLALPGLPGRLLWYAVNMASLVILIVGAWRLSGGGRLEGLPSAPWREHAIFWFGLLCGISSCIDAITNEQTDLIVAAFVILGCHALIRQRDLRAAIWLGIAAAIKCTPLLWAPYLAWRKKWAAALLLGVIAVAVNLIPDVTHPTNTGSTRLGIWASRYLLPMADQKAEPGGWTCGIGGNQSIAGIAQRCLVYHVAWNGTDLELAAKSDRPTPQLQKAVVGGILLVLLSAALACTWRVPAQDQSSQILEFGMVLILMVLMSPHSSKPHFCTLVLPGFCIARAAISAPSRRLLAVLVIAIACALVGNKDLVGAHVFAWGKWYGALAGCALLLYAASCPLLLSRQRRGEVISTDAPAPAMRQAA